MSKSKLATYLNDHLGGSTAALDLLEHLGNTQSDGVYYAGLREAIQADREILEGLLHDLDEKESAVMKSAGWIAEKLGRLKTGLEGMEHRELGLFESLEMLALGIYGKKLLWAALAQVSQGYPQWKEIDFTDLEKRALRQHQSVEEHRLALSAEILGPE